jgi:hypothetical protein
LSSRRLGPAVHDAAPRCWFVGRPGYVERFNKWEMFAFDTNDRAPGKPRTREWTAVGTSELHVLRSSKDWSAAFVQGGS